MKSWFKQLCLSALPGRGGHACPGYTRPLQRTVHWKACSFTLQFHVIALDCHFDAGWMDDLNDGNSALRRILADYRYRTQALLRLTPPAYLRWILEDFLPGQASPLRRSLVTCPRVLALVFYWTYWRGATSRHVWFNATLVVCLGERSVSFWARGPTSFRSTAKQMPLEPKTLQIFQSSSRAC